jgi:hypothetical protein
MAPTKKVPKENAVQGQSSPRIERTETNPALSPLNGVLGFPSPSQNDAAAVFVDLRVDRVGPNCPRPLPGWRQVSVGCAASSRPGLPRRTQEAIPRPYAEQFIEELVTHTRRGLSRSRASHAPPTATEGAVSVIDPQVRFGSLPDLARCRTLVRKALQSGHRPCVCCATLDEPLACAKVVVMEVADGGHSGRDRPGVVPSNLEAARRGDDRGGGCYRELGASGR